MLPLPKFKKNLIDKGQALQLPTCQVIDLLPEDHDCHIYVDLFKQIDTSEVEKKYHHLGQHAYHPRHIMSILIYSYSHGVFSAREIERKCRQDLAFMLISQMNCPNFRVLCDFRKNNAAFFHDGFKQCVDMAIKMGMVSFGHISLDGSKFKANTSKHKAMSYKRLKSQEEKLTTEIDALIEKSAKCDTEEDDEYKESNGYSVSDDLLFKKQRLEKIKSAKKAIEEREASINPGNPIDDKKQISFADHDARIMGKKSTGYDYSYNAQTSVDKDNQIIIGQHISQNANDTQELIPALTAIADATNHANPEKMSMDNGYSSGANLQTLADKDIDAYVATDREEKPGKYAWKESERKFRKSDFIYLEEEDCFVCPANKKLTVSSDSQAKKKRYKMDKEICQNCKFESRCRSDKNRTGRVIQTDQYEPARQAMNKKMSTQEAKDIYSQRKVIAEPPFGQIKNSGFRCFSLRGKEKVAAEFSLVCIAHNFKKMVKAELTGLIHLKDVEKVEFAA